MHKLFMTTCAITIILAAMSGVSTAAEMTVGLERILASSTGDEKIRVIFRVAEAIDGSVLKRELAGQYARRADRHRVALTALQETATITQAGIMPVMNRLQLSNQAENIKTYWIDNLVAADVTPAALTELAARDDIEKIYPYPEISIIDGIEPQALLKPGADRAEYGLQVIGADSMWALGYTGSGRLVATIDTGVDGEHRALASKWRGNNGYSAAESWFDPIAAGSTPHTFGTSEDGTYAHGTSTMSVIVGHDPLTGDTTGVAFGAQWISAATVDITGGDVFSALQWMIDPDGDPNTDEDIPDVISNAWGYRVVGPETYLLGCDDLFWNIMDNLEAAGAITFWAAGNWRNVDGVIYESSIDNPANRATSEVNAFAVGMVWTQEDADTITVRSDAASGPSICDGVSLKPDVVAPGVNIVVAYPGGNYFWNSGSSFAAPHAAGAAALLREYNPNATADEVKTALLLSATDLPPEGDDNRTGYGIINIPAALELMPANTEPHLYIKNTDYPRPQPGGTSELTVTIRNSGISVTDVNVELVSLDDRLTVQIDRIFYGDLTNGAEAVNSTAPFTVTLAADVIPGERIPVEWHFEGMGYERIARGAIAVGTVSDIEVFTHDIGNVRFTVTSIGTYGLVPDSGLISRAGAVGFLHPATSHRQSMFELSFLVGNGPEHISDGARQMSDFSNYDFLADATGKLRIEDPGPVADQQTFAAYSDAQAENPLGVFIEQRSYAYADSLFDDFVILEYVIHNRSDSTLAGLRAAMFGDWDFPWGTDATQGTLDVVRYFADPGVTYMRHKTEAEGLYRGIAVLNPEGEISVRKTENDIEIWDGFSEDEKWDFMNAGLDNNTSVALKDHAHIITTGPWDLGPGDSAVATFAIIGAENHGDMVEFTRRAQRRYNCLEDLDALDIFAIPGEVAFYAELNGELPNERNMAIYNLCTDTNWVIGNVPSWLDIDQLEGRTPDTVTLSVPSIDFEVGSYIDTIFIASPGAPETTYVEVRLTLTEIIPHLRITPDWVSFTSTQFGRLPDEQNVWIINDGTAPMEWGTSYDADWLAISPESGTVAIGESTLVDLTVDTTNVEPGEHRDTVLVDAPSAPENPGRIAVLFDLIASSGVAANDPNPFNPKDGSTTINPGLTGNSFVEIRIYDLTGRLVKTLFAGRLAGGETITWDGSVDGGPLAADGVYLCHIRATDDDEQTRESVLKIAIVKE